MEIPRGQAATEYLVILGAVLLLASIATSNVLSASGTTASIKEQQSTTYWKDATPFSITSYSLESGSLVVTVKNQLPKKLRLTGIDVAASGANYTVFSGSLIFSPSEEKTLYLSFGEQNPCNSLNTGNSFELSAVTFAFDESSDIVGAKQVGASSLVGRCTAAGIPFFPPTPADESTFSAGANITINSSITGLPLSGLGLRWNGTDYAYYDNSLILMMDFDNNSALGENANVAVDVSANAATGQVFGASYVAGASGKAMDFQRQGAINFSTSAQFLPSDQLTVEAWVKKNAAYPIRDLDTGIDAACIALLNGSVMCWGGNGYGQLGIGNTSRMQKPTFVPGITNATAIARGNGGHTCAVLSNGSVSCWGWNAQGQLGNGNTTDLYSPSIVRNISNAIAAKTSWWYSIALLSNGSVMSWGYNGRGQLGIGNTTRMLTPVFVRNITTATAIGIGWSNGCALLANGSIMCWGENGDGELGLGHNTSTLSTRIVRSISTATAISTGWGHSCAILSNRSVMCWGDNGYGQLGIGNETTMYAPVTVPGITTATSISLGDSHTCVLLSSGPMYCWGQGFGSSPTLVNLPERAAKVSAGTAYTCAILSSGGLYCGSYGNGQLLIPFSNRQRTPAPLEGSFGGSASCSYSHCCTLLSNGSVACSGDGQYGALGSGNTDSTIISSIVSGLPTAVEVSTSEDINSDDMCPSSYALLANGSIASWGSNSYGQLGDGTADTRLSPVIVNGITNAQSLSRGGSASATTCAVLSNGSVACWGFNYDGELGNGESTDSYTPVLASGITTATAVSTGNYHTCALLANGSVACWGYNSDGQLGNDDTVEAYTPVFANGITTATAVSAGDYHTCAVLSGGAVMCWGYNSYGQLGTGDNETVYAPTLVNGISATAISTGNEYTCALLTNGSVACWGFNGYGQLGVGNTTARYSPALAQGLSDIVSISTGLGTAYAKDNAGKTYAWGLNDYGMLGIGVFIDTDTYGTFYPLTDGIVAGKAGSNSWQLGYILGGNNSIYASANAVPIAANLSAGWNHVVMTYDRNFLKLYLNGGLANQTALTAPIFNDGAFTVGSGSNGTVDGLRVYNRALSAAEVAQHYRTTLTKYAPDAWMFTSNQTSLVASSYTFSINGTLSSGANVYSEERRIRVT